jgi:hypothetical protein
VQRILTCVYVRGGGGKEIIRDRRFDRLRVDLDGELDVGHLLRGLFAH